MTNIEQNKANAIIDESALAIQFKNLVERCILSNYGRADCFLALHFHQGRREMLQINMHITQLHSFLNFSSDDAIKNNPHLAKNRPVDKEHVQEIKQYVVDRVKSGEKWILGALTANISGKKISIEPIGGNMSLVTIPKGLVLDITDGQHRIRALKELLTSESDGRDLIDKDYMPITLVLEDDLGQCQIDFRDLAQTKPISQAQLVSFGGLGRDGITQILVEQVPMFQGKTQKIKPSPGTGTKFIYTSKYVANAVSCVLANEPNDKLLEHHVEKSAEVLMQCFNQFFSEGSDTNNLFEKNAEQLTVDEVNTFKSDCLLGVSIGLEILGRLLYCTYDEQSNSFNRVMVSKLAKLDWSRSNPLWKNNVMRLSAKSKEPTLTYKITTSASAVSTAIKIVKAQLGWN